MQIDLVLSPFDIDLATLLEAARRAEAAGFDHLWTYDHVSGVVMGSPSVLDVWVTLTAMASVTERVGIGPLVLNATTRDTAQLAGAAASLQQFSGGRLTLGIGAGAGPESPFSREVTMFGGTPLDATRRRERVIETIALLRALWRGDPSYQGSQIGFDGASGILIPDPPPRIVVGANGPKMAALAGAHADGVNLHSWEKDLPGLVAIARDAAAAAGNNDLEISVEVPFESNWLDPDSDERREMRDRSVASVQLRWNRAVGLAALS